MQIPIYCFLVIELHPKISISQKKKFKCVHRNFSLLVCTLKYTQSTCVRINFSSSHPRIKNAKKKMHRCSFYFRQSNLTLKRTISVFTLVMSDDDLFLSKSSMIFEYFLAKKIFMKNENMFLLYFIYIYMG